MKSKVIALFLTVTMMMTIVACGQQNTASSSSNSSSKASESSDAKTESSDDSEDVQGITFPLEETLTVSAINLYYDDDSVISTSERWLAYEEKTNVHFELQEILGSESTEKLNLIMTSGEYPEVFYRANIDKDKYGVEEGILIPLEDLIREYAPNLTALLDAVDGWNEITSADGHIYALPSFGAQSPGKWFFRYNKAWLDNLGLEAPTNMDELYECLKAIKENDANGNGDPDDEIPMTFGSDNFDMIVLYAYVHQSGGYVTARDEYLAFGGDDYKEVSYFPATEPYKEFVATMKKWYQEGLIDELSFIQSYDDLYTIGKTQDQYGFYVANNLGGTERGGDYHVAPVFDDVDGIAVKSSILHKQSFAITDKCENPEIMIAWADGWYTEENTILAYYGIEGTDWEYNDDGYIVKIRETTSLQSGAYIPINLNADVITMLEGYTPEEKPSYFEETELIENYGIVPPVITVSADDNTRYSDLKQSLKEYVKNYLALVVTGEKDLDTTWNEYLEQLEKIGLSEYLELTISGMPDGYVLAQ